MKKLLGVLLTVSMLILSISPILAAPPPGQNNGYLPPYEEPQASPVRGIGSMLLQTLYFLLVFGAVLGLLYLTIRFMKSRIPPHETKWLTIRGKQYIAPNKSLLLIEVAGKMLLLGITEHTINTIAEITDPEWVEFLQRQSGEVPAEGISFWQALQKAAPPKEFQERLARLKRMVEGDKGHEN